MNDVRIIYDEVKDGVRIVSAATCGLVCAQSIDIAVKDGIILGARVNGGCAGNSQAVSQLVVGMKIEEAIKRMEGIDCNYKGTSCPDQFAKALKKLL